MTTSSRPKGITFLAVLSILAAIFNVIQGLLILSGNSEDYFSPVTGMAVLFLAFLNFIFGIGAYALKPWAWMYGLAVQAAGIILAARNFIDWLQYDVFASASLISLIFSGLVLFYLLRPSVKRVFGRA